MEALFLIKDLCYSYIKLFLGGPMRSMTGFGAGTAENADWRVTVTIHSVNHKRLDLRLLMPQIFAENIFFGLDNDFIFTN